MLNRRELLITGAAAAVVVAAGLPLSAAAAVPEVAGTPLRGFGPKALLDVVEGKVPVERVQRLTINRLDSMDFYMLHVNRVGRKDKAEYVRRTALLAELRDEGILQTILDDDDPRHWKVDSRNKTCVPWVNAPARVVTKFDRTVPGRATA